MGLYLSDNQTVLFQYESGTYATTSGASGAWIGLVTDHTPSEDIGIQQIRYAGTANRNVAQIIDTVKDYEGTISFYPQNFRMFAFALGSTTDSGSPSPYTHVISEVNSDVVYPFTSGTSRNNNFASFTIIDSKKSTADGLHQVRKYKGCVVDTLSIGATQGEPVACELKYLAQYLTVGSKTTDIVPKLDEDTTRPFVFSDTKVHRPSGTVLNEVTDWNFSINNNLDRRHYDNGSKVCDNIQPTSRDYELTLTMDASSTTAMSLYNDWQSGNSFNSLIELVASAGSKDGYIIMSGCVISSFESPSPSEGINEYSITIIPTSAVINSDDLIQKFTPW